MNVEISDEMATELIDAYAATFDGAMNYGHLVELVGALLVYIPDPRGTAAPARPVVEPVVERLMRTPKGKLTPHQREVYDRIARFSRRGSDRWVDARNIGSLGACNKLVEKGWITVDITYGPRGGEQYWYLPTTEESA